MVASGRVAVSGGSLGGLTAGLVLRDLGFDVTVYERSAVELEQRGAGIGLLPATSRYLVERGGLAMDQISTVTNHIRHLDRSGGSIHDQQHFYRFSSWNTVYRSLLDCFGRERYLLDHAIQSFTQHDGVVDLQMDGGRSDTVDLLVCAEGVTSKARRVLQPAVRPRYSGYVAWRGIVPEASLTPATNAILGDAITYFVTANSHILTYPIPGLDGSVEHGRRLINFVWYRNYLEGGDLSDVLTDELGNRHDTSLPPGTARSDHVAELRATASARLPPQLAEVVHATETPFLQVIFDVEIEQMAFGRVCLIGDAAWLVRPHAAAGTAKAAADAWALSDALEHHHDIPPALAAWEPDQMKLGRQLLERTRRIGRRSQTDQTWTPGDPELIFGLNQPGD